jgi:hypothetical protein
LRLKVKNVERVLTWQNLKLKRVLPCKPTGNFSRSAWESAPAKLQSVTITELLNSLTTGKAAMTNLNACVTKPLAARSTTLAVATLFFSVFCMASAAEAPNGASTATVSNGIASGDGQWSVDFTYGGNTETASFNSLGPSSSNDLMSRYETYIDVGADGNAFSLSRPQANPNSLTTIAPNTVLSTGQFSGQNGPINWAATIRILPGSFRYEIALTFTSAQPFGPVRMINYMDASVAALDKLVAINAPSSASFALLNIDSDGSSNAGIAQTASYQSAINATYVGWHGANFSTPPVNLLDLITLLSQSGAPYSIPGIVNPQNFFTTTDTRFPFSPVYGPADPVHAMAFDLAPTATTATISFGFTALNIVNDALFRDGFQ